jgi:predicted dehydrogenase
MLNKKVKIGVLGVGHLGQHHVKHLKNIDNFNLIGIFDINFEQASKIASKYKTKVFKSMSTLIEEADALSIVTPTDTHSQIAEKCLTLNKHVFIEKPISETLNEADKIITLADKKNLIVQIGHIERVNPALLALKPYNVKPKFIEIQRLAPYSIRGTEVPVVLDKMIHDIDILLSIVNSPVKKIQANGISIITDSIDIAHARIKFQNNTVASITSSRIAKEDIRKMKLFQRDLYCTIDLLLGLTEIYRIKNETHSKSAIQAPFNYKGSKKIITYEKPTLNDIDPLKMELINFGKSIIGTENPIVTGKNGRDALEIAIKINKLIIEDTP